MAYIIVEADLTRLLYQDKINEIKRDDTNVVGKAISAALKEAMSYCSRYDIDKLFGTDSTDATVTDENLQHSLVQMACYKLVQLNNPGVNVEEYRLYYDDAVAWFKRVMKGDADPVGWPLKEDNEDGTEPGNRITYSGKTKRNDSY